MPSNKHQLHRPTGRWQLGFCLSFTSAFLWGVLPIALKPLLEKLNAHTISCTRFLIAGVLLSILVMTRKRFPAISKPRRTTLWLFVIAVVMLCGNYVLYAAGLGYLSPSAATVVIQLGPMFMLLGSLIVFKESFSLRQWLGFVILLFGQALFFNDRITMLLSNFSNYTAGVLLIALAGLLWAIFTMAKKQLLRTISTEAVMLVVYYACGLLLLPFASLAQVGQLGIGQLLLVGLCGFNTFAAYGCLAGALKHWEASRVSMVLAVTPLVTIVSMKCCAVMFPGFISSEQFNVLSIAGAMLVVVGPALCAFSRAKNRKATQV